MDKFEKHLKEFEYKKINNHLWMTWHDKEIIELATKVTTMFTPVKDTFAYKSIMIQFDDLKQDDARAATYCSV